MEVHDLILAIAGGLGLFEAGKLLILHFVRDSVIKRNLDIRAIAERFSTWTAWLKLRNFEQTLPQDVEIQLNHDALRLRKYHKLIADGMFELMRSPTHNALLYRIFKEKPDELFKELSKSAKRHNSMADTIIEMCEDLIYKPIWDYKKTIKILKKKIKTAI